MLTRRILEVGFWAVFATCMLFSTDQVMRAPVWVQALMLTVLLGESIARRVFPTPDELARKRRA